VVVWRREGAGPLMLMLCAPNFLSPVVNRMIKHLNRAGTDQREQTAPASRKCAPVPPSAPLRIQLEFGAMRVREIKFVIVGLMLVAAFGCRPKPPSPEERIPVPLPAGWRVGQIRNIHGGRFRVGFLPKKKTYRERLWIEQIRDPKILSKSSDELLQMILPVFICKEKNLNFLKREYGDTLFEEKDSICYGKPYRLTLARIARGRSVVSFYAYRADQLELPPGDRDFILKTLSSAPFPTDASPGDASATTTPSSNASPAAAAAGAH
jgi:hypothetical protein